MYCTLELQYMQWWHWCKLSVGVALNARFTTNGMCAKNNTHMYVVRTSNNKVIPMEWSRWMTSNNACEPGDQVIVRANGDDERDLVRWTLLLLDATVRSFVFKPLGLSNRNKMVLCAGYEGCVGFSLHTKNVRSVQLIVERRGCCCNHSAGVALKCTVRHEQNVCKEEHPDICGANQWCAEV